MSTTARQSVKAYRSQRARFADPAYVTRRRAGAAFLAPVPQGAPARPITSAASAARTA
jgi:hypothetical protein